MQRINVSDVARLLYLHAMHYQTGNTEQDQDYHQCQHHTRMEINIFAPKCRKKLFGNDKNSPFNSITIQRFVIHCIFMKFACSLLM